MSTWKKIPTTKYHSIIVNNIMQTPTRTNELADFKG